MNRGLKNFNQPTSCSSLSIKQDEQQFIFQYMWLQYLRTDAGRINYINYIEILNHMYQEQALLN